MIHLSRPKIYWSLILGFFLKSVGAAWDVSYHFKHFREFYQLPHIVNMAGDAVLLFLLFYLWFRGPASRRAELKIILGGILVFIVGIFFDQWYHETFGLDLTIWSPAHLVLYSGTFMSLIGYFLYFLKDFRENGLPFKLKKVISVLFSFFMLDSFWFLLTQHETGVIMEYDLARGIQLADQELLDIFFRTQGDIYSGLPVWLYGAWAALSAVVIFQFIKKMDFHKYGATIVAGIYLLERFIMHFIFSLIDYPLSALPFYLILIAFIFDLLYNKLKNRPLERDIATCAVPIAFIIFVGFISTNPPIHPPIAILPTILAAIPAAIIGYIFTNWLYRRFFASAKENY